MSSVEIREEEVREVLKAFATVIETVDSEFGIEWRRVKGKAKARPSTGEAMKEITEPLDLTELGVPYIDYKGRKIWVIEFPNLVTFRLVIDENGKVFVIGARELIDSLALVTENLFLSDSVK